MISTPIARHLTFQHMASLVETVLDLERRSIAHERCFVRGVSVRRKPATTSRPVSSRPIALIS
jgi:hypothetical protein